MPENFSNPIRTQPFRFFVRFFTLHVDYDSSIHDGFGRHVDLGDGFGAKGIKNNRIEIFTNRPDDV
jgi:hypothetical protein